MNRYHRQILLAQIGEAGQQKLSASRVLLVGCGALGCNIADQMVRAGVGFVRIVDRDIVELTNLQRQILFDESHARKSWPKALAAQKRLRRINSQVTIESLPTDFNSSNALMLADSVDLILDGTDNVSTRYLINDVAVKLQKPWIYGACVGTEGRVMGIWPGKSACLRCLFPQPPDAQGLATCDTAGILAAAAAIVASIQVTYAIQLLTGDIDRALNSMLSIDVWKSSFRSISLAQARQSNCPCCALHQFDFLARRSDSTASLCGRDAVQICENRPIQLPAIANVWNKIGIVEQNKFFLRCEPTDPAGIKLTLFGDGRLIVQGTRDINRAKAIYAKFVGN